MPRNKKRPSELRVRAELHVRAARKQRPAVARPVNARRVLHELEVHQAELEIQNEELRGARGEVELALARFTELFDFAPIGYATLCADGAVGALNHAGARLLGKPRGQVAGAPFEIFVVANDRAAIRALLQRVLEGEAGTSCELELSSPGRSLKVHVTASVVARAEHPILVAFQDITERLAREAQLARAEQALREANRRKDDFLAMLSHELRNPLGPLSGGLFILDHVDPASQQARDTRVIIERQVTHLTRLVDDLLDVTRITRGKIQLQRERVELGELVRRAIDDHRANLEAHGLHLEARLEPGPFWLDADPARLVQIASNLLGNAEKFTLQGGTVTVRLAARGDQAVLSVRDTGVGIAPELIGGMFEPFAQAPQALDRSRGGLGLGLAMVKGMVEAHGGQVRIASEGAGCGTEVTVALPLATGPVAEVRAPAPVVQARRRVLVIEDNADAGELLGDTLEIMGHDVQVVDRGAAGIALARSFRPAAVICDLGLPEMDGYAVAAAFRADPALRGIGLIALSGYARPEDQLRALEAGFDHHVAKPPDLEKLRRLIAETALTGEPEAAPAPTSASPHPL